MRSKIRVLAWMVLGLTMAFAASHAEVVDRIVAIVNDDIITLSELDSAIQPFLVKLNAENYPPEKKKKIAFKLRNDILERMIERKLTDQEVRRYNIRVSESEIDQSIERFKKAQSITHEELLAALEQDGLTYEDYRDRMRKELVRPKLINRTIKSKVIVTDEEIKAYYDENSKDFQGTSKYHLKNIIHKDKALMDELLMKLDNNESFTALAKSYSKGGNAAQGGELGKFGLDAMSEQIQKSLDGLEKGQHTRVVSTDQGYQIFYIEDIIVDGALTYEEAAQKILEILYNKEAEKKFSTWLETLKKNAHIKTML
ncbi:MAG: parvulin peptidyl-prolyl isomerase [Desulfobacteraceae bacterium]|nr:MAG: parvulin peptidyl-prolyl isomerase [Desulfobacteraceae bacterium]